MDVRPKKSEKFAKISLNWTTMLELLSRVEISIFICELKTWVLIVFGLSKFWNWVGDVDVRLVCKIGQVRQLGLGKINLIDEVVRL